MTPFDRSNDAFDRRLFDALDGLASPQFPDYFDDVLAGALAHRQRPAWTFLERWIPVSTLTRRPALFPSLPWRTVGILLALMALLVAGAVISFGLRSDDVPDPFGPAENGRVAYIADGDIFSRDLETGSVDRLVGGAPADVYPLFSLDGRSLAWVRLEEAGDEASLMIADADGANARRVLGPTTLDALAWAPSSDELAVVASNDDQRLFVVPVTGGEPRAIPVPVVPEGEIAWRAPDGDELLFLGSDAGRYAVYGVAPDGTGFRKISPDGETTTYAGPWDVTHDGSQLVYTSAGRGVQISVLDLETGESRPYGSELPALPDRVGPEHHGSASLLPDGATIVFGRYWNEANGEINHQLWSGSLSGDGADAVAIGPVHRSRSGHNPFWQAVAPDGESILVVENDTFDAWLADPSGGTPEAIDLGELGDPPSWQRLAP
jgi:hypothetical protein